MVDAGLKSLSCERGIPMVKDVHGLSIRRLRQHADATVNLHD